MKYFILLIFITISTVSYSQTEAFYVFRNDKAFNVIVLDWNDEIEFSNLDMDSVEHDTKQTLVILEKDTLYRIPISSIDSMSCPRICPDDNHPHAIDLGLPSGTKWSCCNVGATTPSQYGGYYASCETMTKEVYNDLTYPLHGGIDTNNDGFYDADWTYEHVGRKYGKSSYDISGTEWDAAYVNMGQEWIMPTLDQAFELQEKCLMAWGTKDGVAGMFILGQNKNLLFMPATGCYSAAIPFGQGDCGYYWTSIIGGTGFSARGMDIKRVDPDFGAWSTCTEGRAVRAVKK